METEMAGSVWRFRANYRRVIWREITRGRIELELENGIQRRLPFRRQIFETIWISGSYVWRESVLVRWICLKTVGAGVGSHPLNRRPADRAYLINRMNRTMASLVISGQ
jgi:hypothetical protein